jgi:hypothetical protein
MTTTAIEIRWIEEARAHRVRMSRPARLRIAKALSWHEDTRALGVSLGQADGGEIFVAGVQAGVVRAAAALCRIPVSDGVTADALAETA